MEPGNRREEEHEFSFGYVYKSLMPSFSFGCQMVGVDEGCVGHVGHESAKQAAVLFFFFLYHVASNFPDYFTFSLAQISLHSFQHLESVWALRLSQAVSLDVSLEFPVGPEHPVFLGSAFSHPGLSVSELMQRREEWL